jgi:hypothetical protein
MRSGMQHIAYIITSRRKNGPRLDKTFGNIDGYYFFLSRHDAECLFETLQDPEFWEILEVEIKI